MLLEIQCAGDFLYLPAYWISNEMQVFGFSLILYLLNKLVEKDCITFPLNKAHVFHFQKAMSKNFIF